MSDKEPDFRAHIIAEDPRYPTLCINGEFNYGVSFDPQTGEIGQDRHCICGARYDIECICDVEHSDATIPKECVLGDTIQQENKHLYKPIPDICLTEKQALLICERLENEQRLMAQGFVKRPCAACNSGSENVSFCANCNNERYYWYRK